MPRHAYLNELSFANRHVPTEHGRRLFERFFRLLREINRRSPGVTVVGHRRLTELSIGDCSIGAWLRDDPDRKRRIRVLQDRAPFDADLERMAAETADVLEYSHGDQIAIGLGLAAWHDELAVSVDLPPWQTESVELQCHTLLENAAGDVAVETSAVVARNATGPGHLQAHDEWLRRPDTDMPRTPDELWLNRAQWYPNVAFAGRVERQIRGLPAREALFKSIVA